MLKIILELYKMSMVLYIKQLKFKFTLQLNILLMAKSLIWKFKLFTDQYQEQ